ncbi:hypothetical protein HanRHA438_Chr13g0597991 [Helianthus annuus]|nr:hypothetical protein HanRHA438_Chr13g0597991 [Helianthus annuus]
MRFHGDGYLGCPMFIHTAVCLSSISNVRFGSMIQGLEASQCFTDFREVLCNNQLLLPILPIY